jgi:dephospho-CoA kinase
MAKFKRLVEKTLLREKQILLSNGANYNQAVFLAGGAGSGKGFASKKFMEGEKFRRFDVDRWKENFLDLAGETEKYPEISNLNLQNPQDVSKLHRFVKDKGIHNRFVNNVLKNNERGRLPNVMFDVTLKEVDKLERFIPLLHQSGYSSQNVHLVWVLADYEIAVKRNRNRERIVPQDILLKTHTGAANTIIDLVDSGNLRGLDGSVHVILNNPEHTVFHADEDGDPIEASGEPVDLPGDLKQSQEYEPEITVEDFEYLTLKQKGKPFRDVLEIKETLAQWIKRNAPKMVTTWEKLSAL